MHVALTIHALRTGQLPEVEADRAWVLAHPPEPLTRETPFSRLVGLGTDRIELLASFLWTAVRDGGVLDEAEIFERCWDMINRAALEKQFLGA